MVIQIFFCYAHEDELLLDELKKQLRPLQRQGLIDMWHDRNISAGNEWEQEISKYLNAAQIIVLLVSPDFMDSDYCYGVEMKRSMKRHERGEAIVIPVILRPVYWQGEPFGNLLALPTDAKPVTDPAWGNVDRAFFNVAEGIRKAIKELTTKISGGLLEQPDKNADIAVGKFPKVDWGEAPYTGQFYGRDKELAKLKQWVVDDGCRAISIVGIGGIGKTSLVGRSVDQVKDRFAYIFWRSLQNAPLPKKLLQDCIQFISDQQRVNLPEDTDGQISLLIEYLRERHCLVVFDNFESILQAGNPAGHYKEGYGGYETLLQRIGETRHQSCLLLTSREKPREIAYLEGTTASVRSLQVLGLGQAEGRQILKDKGLSVSDEAWPALIDYYSGNPLALKLVSEPIRELFGGNVLEFLKERELGMGMQDLLEQQFKRLSILEREIMYWLAIERETTSLKDLREDIVYPMSKGELLAALKSLRQRSMLESGGAGRFTLQPVIMEYVTDRFIEQFCEEIGTETETVGVFVSHALTKAQSKEYIRDTQVRLILAPIAERLLATMRREEIEEKLKKKLSLLRQTQPQKSGYAAANALNLLIHLQCHLGGYDFSYLAIRQAYLQGVTLPGVSFAHSNLVRSIFTDTFGSILSVTLSPSGKLLAAGTANGEIWLWETSDSMPILIWQGHSGWIKSIAFSPDESVLASVGENQAVCLWDVNTGQSLKMLYAHDGWIWSVAFSPDGNMIASGGEDRAVLLWDVSTGKNLKALQGHNNWVWSVAFSPDGSMLASGSEDQTIRIWDVNTGQILKTLLGHANQVRSVAFSPDGCVLASSSNDKSVRIWDVNTGQVLKILQGHTNQVRSVAFSSDKNILASGSEDQTIRIWDVNTGQILKTLLGHTNRVRSISFSSDGTTLASNEDQIIYIWDVNIGQVLKILHGYGSWVRSVSFSPDGGTLASGSEDRTVRIWDVNTGQVLKILYGHDSWVRSVAFSPDGNVLASGSDDRTVRIWSVNTGQTLNILRGHANPVRSIAFSPDGSMLASGAEDQTVQIWDARTGQVLRTFRGHTTWVASVAFSPDGSMLATGSEDQTIRIWNVRTGECITILPNPTERVRSVAFSPDSSILASGNDQSICLWEISTGKSLHVMYGHTLDIHSVAFSPDGSVLASGSGDRSVRLWEISTGQCITTLQGHTKQVWSVVFSPDAKFLASGSEDGTIRVWDVQGGEYLKTLRSDRPYERMNITGVTGVTEAQKATLRALGAIDDRP